MASNLDWLIVGGNGLIWRSTNFGVSWFAQNSRTTSRLTSVEFPSNTDLAYCVGYDGTILKTTNNGGSWGLQQSTTTRNLHSVFFYINNNVGYAVGDSGTILKTNDGGGPMVSVKYGQSTQTPREFSLCQNYPNPFNPATTISFSIPSRLFVSLKVLDALGREVTVLFSEELSAGTYSQQWSTTGLASGVYFYRLQAGSFTEVMKLILLR
jgi:hypothetical protein